MPRLVVSSLILLVLGACGPREEGLVDYRLIAMATSVEIRLPAAASRDHPELIATIESDLHRMERDYYAWADGELGRLNRALSEDGEFEASEEMAGLLARSRAIAARTDWAFDPGVGALVELWGFEDASNPPSAPPPDAAISAILADSVSIRDIAVDGKQITAPDGIVLLDLGGIAKGAVVDRIVEHLEAAGVTPALVNAGGDLRVVGEPEGRRWRIGVQAPRGDGLLGTIALAAGEAAFSSGDYERYFDRNGERLHHILDPRTGRPATGTQAVTVIAADGTMADAAATGLFVAGPDEWRAMAGRLGIEAVLRVDADGSVEMTPEMHERFRALDDTSSDIIAARD